MCFLNSNWLSSTYYFIYISYIYLAVALLFVVLFLMHVQLIWNLKKLLAPDVFVIGIIVEVQWFSGHLLGLYILKTNSKSSPFFLSYYFLTIRTAYYLHLSIYCCLKFPVFRQIHVFKYCWPNISLRISLHIEFFDIRFSVFLLSVRFLRCHLSSFIAILLTPL